MDQSSVQDMLYDFQREGVEWIVENGKGFIWDDPGLGKTRQAIEAAHRLCPAGPILIICPNILKSWWRKEIVKIHPEDREQILVCDVAGRFRYFSSKYGTYLENYNSLYVKPTPKWVVVHYAGVRISLEHYQNIDWRVVVLDECHYIKNRKAARSSAVHQVTPPTAHRIGLTATPFSANPADIWNQLKWMAPNKSGLRSYWKFFNTFTNYITEYNPRGRRYKKIIGGKNLKTLGVVMSTYGVRRRKTDVAKQIPPITADDMPLSLDLSKRQLAVYGELRSKAVEVVIKHSEQPNQTSPSKDGEGFKVTGLLIKNMLSRLVKMEQWLSCPWKFDPGVEGVKMSWLKEWASAYPHPAVIATRFKSTAKGIAQRLGVQYITGDVTIPYRNKIIQEWKDGKYQFLVGTIHTIGTGLNLQEAHAMVCYDQVHSPILMEQLINRIHRIDSDHPVQILYLYVEGTSNEVVLGSFKEHWKQMEIVRRYVELITKEKVT